MNLYLCNVDDKRVGERNLGWQHRNIYCLSLNKAATKWHGMIYIHKAKQISRSTMETVTVLFPILCLNIDWDSQHSQKDAYY